MELKEINSMQKKYISSISGGGKGIFAEKIFHIIIKQEYFVPKQAVFLRFWNTFWNTTIALLSVRTEEEVQIQNRGIKCYLIHTHILITIPLRKSKEKP